MCLHVLILALLACLLERAMDVEAPVGSPEGVILTAVTRADPPPPGIAGRAPLRGRPGADPPTGTRGAHPPTDLPAPRAPARPAGPPPRTSAVPSGAVGGAAPEIPKAPRSAPGRRNAEARIIDVPARPVRIPGPSGTSLPHPPSEGPGGPAIAPGSSGGPGSSSTPAPYGGSRLPGAAMRADLALYSHEMGQRLRQYHHLYFAAKQPDDWTIASYRVDRQGRVHDARVIDTTTPGEISRRVLLVLEEATPFPPLPEGLEALEVVELFWSTPRGPFPPGSRAEALSHLADGREITAIESTSPRR